VDRARSTQSKDLPLKFGHYDAESKTYPRAEILCFLGVAKRHARLQLLFRWKQNEMTKESSLKWLLRVRDALCITCLILLVLSEGYTAAATALDPHVPAWERTLGWALLALPCSLSLGLALLLYGDRKRLGFYCAALSLLFYVAAICREVFQSNVETGDWIDLSAWSAFCAVGIGAARLLMTRSSTD
jgi:hypothetical protein